jgi:hypothetical protein
MNLVSWEVANLLYCDNFNMCREFIVLRAAETGPRDPGNEDDSSSCWYIACEQALKLNWEPASMTNEFEYLRLKSWREFSLVRCYNLYVSAELYICQLLKHYA